jgi:hypothetical protein
VGNHRLGLDPRHPAPLGDSTSPRW